MVTAPDLMTAAAGHLTNIGATLEEATAAASGPTTGIAAAATDEVSMAISQLFGEYGQEFRAASAQATAFQAEFVQLLNGGAAAYLSTELTNAGQNLANAVNAPVQSLLNRGPTALAAETTGGAYQQLFTNTAVNLRALGSSWLANPLPFFRQFVINQQSYGQQISAAFAAAIQNFPANLENLPAEIQAAIQEIVTFPTAYYAQQIIATQLAFARTFVSSTVDAFAGLLAGLPQFGDGVRTAFQTLLTGDYNTAAAQLAQAYQQLLITGYDTSNTSLTLTGDITHPATDPTVTATAYPKLIGPLEDFFVALNIPAQDAQFFTNLMRPSIARQIAQNFTNVLNTLTQTNVVAQTTFPVYATYTGITTLTYSLPLVLTYSAVGPIVTTFDAFGASLDSFNRAIAAGNLVGAAGAIIDAPANLLDAFLNGQVIVDDRIPVPFPDIVIPTGFPPPLPSTVTIPTPKDASITPHIPFDGLLVQPSYLTATVDVPSYQITFPPVPPPFPQPTPITIPGVNFTGTVFGTPAMGLGPLLINYAPQQLALAITPTT